MTEDELLADVKYWKGRFDALQAEIIEECAKVCDAHADWAEKHIESDPSSTKSQLFATISNTANDCAAMIRDLAKTSGIREP